MDLQEVGCGDMDWIDLAQDTDNLRTLVYAVWTFPFHKMRWICWLGEDLLASQEEFCSMELGS
jgi:hypothetical protein